MNSDSGPNPPVRGTAKTLVVLFALGGALVVLGLLLAWAGGEWDRAWRWTAWSGLIVLTGTTLYGWLWGAPEPPPAPGPEGTRVVTTPNAGVHAEGGSSVVRWLADHLEPVFAWVVAYPLFPLQIVLFWSISWFDFGGGLGVPDLVWGSDWWMRLWVGVSVSALFGNALFVRAVLDRRPGSTPPTFFDNSPSLLWFVRDDVLRRIGSFLTWAWLPALVVFYAPVVRNDWVFPGDGVPGMMLLGLLAGLAGVMILVWVFEWAGLSARWKSSGLFRSLPGFRPPNRVIPESDRELHAVGMLLFGIPAAFCVLLLVENLLYGAVWSPVWVFILLLVLFNMVYGFITFHLAGLQYVLFLAAVAVLLVSNFNNTNKMTLPGLEKEYDKNPNERVDLDKDPTGDSPDWLIRTPVMLAQFEAKHTQDGRKPKLVVIATTGGGIQAAVWTAIVLEALENDPALKAAGFRDRVRLITGASGGMQAAALYAADFENPKRMPHTPLHQQLARDSLWPTAQKMLFNDLPGAFWPKQLKDDRGRKLEAAWERNCTTWWEGGAEGHASDPPNWYQEARGGYYYDPDSPMGRTFGDLMTKEKTCDRPSLVFSPMLVEDCRRVMISNLALDWFTATNVSNLNPDPHFQTTAAAATASVPALEFWRYFPDAHNHFKVGTAARMSATFPFVGPAVSLPTNPPRRVVDAGYFDNFGINFTAMWLHHYRAAIRAHTSGVVVIEVRAYPRRQEKVRFTQIDPDDGEAKPESFHWAVAEVSSPLEAMYNLYARSAYFRNDQLLHLLDEELNPPAWVPWITRDNKFFTTVTFECNQPAALSWTLPKRSYDELRAVFDTDAYAEVMPKLSAKKAQGLDKSRDQRAETMERLREWFIGKQEVP